MDGSGDPEVKDLLRKIVSNQEAHFESIEERQNRLEESVTAMAQSVTELAQTTIRIQEQNNQFQKQQEKQSALDELQDQKIEVLKDDFHLIDKRVSVLEGEREGNKLARHGYGQIRSEIAALAEFYKDFKKDISDIKEKVTELEKTQIKDDKDLTVLKGAGNQLIKWIPWLFAGVMTMASLYYGTKG